MAKTAMQELIEILKEELMLSHESWQDILNDALKKEKQQLYSAVDGGMAIANNLCIQISDRYNSDDETTEAHVANECAKRIRDFIPFGEEYFRESYNGKDESKDQECPSCKSKDVVQFSSTTGTDHHGNDVDLADYKCSNCGTIFSD